MNDTFDYWFSIVGLLFALFVVILWIGKDFT